MIKLTKKRKIVYDQIRRSNKSLNAQMIYNLIEDEIINLSTVYRALEFLYHNNLINRTNLDNVSYYFVNKHEHHHYMICENCHQKIEFDCKLNSIIKDISSKYDFKIISHDLNFYGLCQNCQKEL